MKNVIDEVLSKEQIQRYAKLQPVEQWLGKRQIPYSFPAVSAMQSVLDLDPRHENQYVRIVENRRGRIYGEEHIA